LKREREELLLSLSFQALENKTKKRELKKILEEESEWKSLLEKETALSFYYNLSQSSLHNLIPSSIEKELKKSLISNTGYNLISLHNLAPLIQRLKEQRIPVIVLKGAALCEVIYPHLGLRSFCDVDILIQKKNVQKVSSELKKMGYSLCRTHARHHFFAFQKTNHSLPLEVHWDLVNRASPFQKYAFKFSMEKIWKDARPIQMGGVKTLWLSPEHQLIYLSAHMLKEGYANKKWFLDLFYLLKFFEGKINWEKLLKESEEFQVRRPVFYALSYLDRYFLSEEVNQKFLARNVLPRLKPERSGWPEKAILARLLEDKVSKKPLCRLSLYLSAIEGIRNRLKALVSLLIYIPKITFLQLKAKIQSAPEIQV